MSRLVRLLHDLGVSAPLVAEPQTDLIAATRSQIVVEKIFGHVETLGKLRHILLRKTSGVGSGEWGVGAESGVGSGEQGNVSYPHSPFPIPHSPFPIPYSLLFQ